MKVGDRVIHRFTKRAGVIIDIWDGKYRVDYYEGEQYNPYRVTVKFDKGTEEEPADCIKMEHLEQDV